MTLRQQFYDLYDSEPAVLLAASRGLFSGLPPKHEPERFVFPWQPIPNLPIFSAPQAPEGSK